MKGLFAGILILILLGLGSAFIATQQNQTPTPFVPGATTTVPYASVAGHISFDYPNTYRLVERSDSFEGTPITVITLIDKNMVVPDMSEGPPSISIIVVPKATSTTLETWVKTKSISNFNLSPSQKLYPVVVAGKDALNYTHSGLYESEAYTVENNGNVYLLSVGSINHLEQIYTDFQNLLKTVQLQ